MTLSSHDTIATIGGAIPWTTGRRSAPSSDATMIDVAHLERLYRHVGDMRASPQAREELERELLAMGRDGLGWLLGRLSRERNEDALLHAADLVAAFAARAPEHWRQVANALETADVDGGQPSHPRLEAMLRALGQTEIPGVEATRAVRLAHRFTATDDPALREQTIAFVARMASPPGDVVAALLHDPDPDVRDTAVATLAR